LTVNRYGILRLLLLWFVIGLCHTLLLSHYIDLKVSVLALHAMIRALVFFGLNILLNYALIYSHFSALPPLQRRLNVSLLAILCVGLWIALGFVFDYLSFGQTTAQELSKMNRIYAAFGLSLFVIILQSIHIHTIKNENETEHPATTAFQEGKDVAEKAEILEHIAVRANSKINVLSVAEIYFFTSDGDYVMIHTENAKYLKEQTMKYFEQHLPSAFIRIHRSAIVNTEKISRVELLEKQTYYLILKNNQRLKMSVAGYKFLRMKLGL